MRAWQASRTREDRLRDGSDRNAGTCVEMMPKESQTPENTDTNVWSSMQFEVEAPQRAAKTESVGGAQNPYTHGVCGTAAG